MYEYCFVCVADRCRGSNTNAFSKKPGSLLKRTDEVIQSMSLNYVYESVSVCLMFGNRAAMGPTFITMQEM